MANLALATVLGLSDDQRLVITVSGSVAAATVGVLVSCREGRDIRHNSRRWILPIVIGLVAVISTALPQYVDAGSLAFVFVLVLLPVSLAAVAWS